MTTFFMLLVCFVGGMVLKHFGRLDESAAKNFNSFVIYLLLPFLIIHQIHEMKFDSHVVFPIMVAWITFFGGVVFFWIVGKFVKLDRLTMGALMLTGGFGSTSFVGISTAQGFFGDWAVPIAVLIAQAGSCIVMPTMGVVVATIYSSTSDEIRIKDILWNLLKFPPFIALVIAFALIPFDFWPFIDHTLSVLGDSTLLGVLTFTSVGAQIRLSDLKYGRTPLFVGCLYKMLVAPLIVFLAYGHFLPSGNAMMQISIFESAMPTNVTASAIATQHHLNPKLASVMVTVTLVVSLITLPLLALMLK